MARNDIRLVIGFHRNLKIRKLYKVLGADGVLSLLVLWQYVAENRPSGILSGLGVYDIADAAEWKGIPRKFVRTLLSVGLLDEMDDGNLAIHDWKDHQPWIFGSESRSARARLAAESRWKSPQTMDSPDAERMRDACATHAERYAPSPSPSPNQDQDLPSRGGPEDPGLAGPPPRSAENPPRSSEARAPEKRIGGDDKGDGNGAGEEGPLEQAEAGAIRDPKLRAITERMMRKAAAT